MQLKKKKENLKIKLCNWKKEKKKKNQSRGHKNKK